MEFNVCGFKDGAGRRAAAAGAAAGADVAKADGGEAVKAAGCGDVPVGGSGVAAQYLPAPILILRFQIKRTGPDSGGVDVPASKDAEGSVCLPVGGEGEGGAGVVPGVRELIVCAHVSRREP